MVLIIFEGLPGSGKTTIIKYLGKKLRIPFITELMDKNRIEITPKESEDKDFDFFLQNDILKYSEGSKECYKETLVLMDRGIYSTLVYNSCIPNLKNLKKVKRNCELINKKYDKNSIYIYINIDQKTALSGIDFNFNIFAKK